MSVKIQVLRKQPAGFLFGGKFPYETQVRLGIKKEVHITGWKITTNIIEEIEFKEL